MRKAEVYLHNQLTGYLTESSDKRKYTFQYLDDYDGPAVSLTMPVRKKEYEFDRFPPFFEGLLPEGYQLAALLKQKKLDRSDLFGQLLAVGEDLVGAVTVKPASDG